MSPEYRAFREAVEAIGAYPRPYDTTPTIPPQGCEHPLLPTPAFDPTAIKGLTRAQIKAKFPRGYGKCPNCGDDVISYASFQHYIAGDW